MEAFMGDSVSYQNLKYIEKCHSGKQNYLKPLLIKWCQKLTKHITHQFQRSIINLISGCGRTDSYLNLHLDETSRSCTVSVQNSLGTQGI